MQIIGLFTKFWRPGQVKTRLAASIGETAAASVYRCFVQHLTRELSKSGDERYFVVSPDEDVQQESFQSSANWQSTGQGTGHLGDRLTRFFTRLQNGNSMIVIGGDSPTLSAARISTAFGCLDEYDCVLGPSQDGGYYLIGLRGPWTHQYDCLFADVSWGTEMVLSQTIERLRDSGISFEQLPVDNDVDTIDDLNNLMSELSETGQQALLSELRAILSGAAN